MQEILKEIDSALAVSNDGFIIDPKVLGKAYQALLVTYGIAVKWCDAAARGPEVDARACVDHEIAEAMK